MQKLEVKSKEYKIFDIKDEVVLFTKELGRQLAYSFFSSSIEKVALGRNLDKDQISSIINIMISNNPDIVIEVRIVGGDHSKESKLSLVNLINSLLAIDGGKDIIDIKSFDVCERFHPEAFEVDHINGGLRAIW
jgi:hypothetical protein